MRILGIETSCDETAAAVVEKGRKIQSSVVASQVSLHQRFSGVVPELASRAHVESLNAVVAQALSRLAHHPRRPGCPRTPSGRSSSSCLFCRIDAIAVTVGPGLAGSLLVGTVGAQAMGLAHHLPVIGVNHLEGHLFAGIAEHASLTPPFLGLIVSGGHTELVIVEKYGKYHRLGQTRDDAVGEAFDKVGALLNLGYPGGPAVDRLSRKGDPAAVSFPRPFLHGSWDFSFSGLKTAVANFLKAHNGDRGNGIATADICASFQASVVEVLVKKTIDAAQAYRIPQIVVGGGVAANKALREVFEREAWRHRLRLFLPSHALCTDNAAMIAAAAYYKWQYQKGFQPEKTLSICPNLAISDWS